MPDAYPPLPGGPGGYAPSAGPPPGGYGAAPGGGPGVYTPPPGAAPGVYTPPGWGAPAGFVPMPQNLPPGYTPDTGTAALAGGVPWEQKGGSFVAKWWATVKAVNNDTRPFFAAAGQNESGDAITFAMVSGAVSGAAIGLFYFLIFAAFSAGLMIALPGLGHGAKGSAGGAAMAAGFTFGMGIFYALMITVMSAMTAAVRPFLWGGLHHVLLSLFGGIGERKTFMHTVRVAAYAEGASMPWIWVPIAGPFIAIFFGIKDLVQGYDEVHRCGTGKALLVLFSPLICCCACNLLLALLGVIPALL